MRTEKLEMTIKLANIPSDFLNDCTASCTNALISFGAGRDVGTVKSISRENNIISVLVVESPVFQTAGEFAVYLSLHQDTNFFSDEPIFYLEVVEPTHPTLIGVHCVLC